MNLLYLMSVRQLFFGSLFLLLLRPSICGRGGRRKGRDSHSITGLFICSPTSLCSLSFLLFATREPVIMIVIIIIINFMMRRMNKLSSRSLPSEWMRLSCRVWPLFSLLLLLYLLCPHLSSCCGPFCCRCGLRFRGSRRETNDVPGTKRPDHSYAYGIHHQREKSDAREHDLPTDGRTSDWRDFSLLLCLVSCFATNEMPFCVLCVFPAACIIACLCHRMPTTRVAHRKRTCPPDSLLVIVEWEKKRKNSRSYV